MTPRHSDTTPDTAAGTPAPAARRGPRTARPARGLDTFDSGMRRVLRHGVRFGAAGLVLAAIGGGLWGGAPGAIGAAIGMALPLAFFAVSVVVAVATANSSPQTMASALLGSWIAKAVIAVAILAGLDRVGGWSRPAFGVAFLIGIIGWLTLESAVLMRMRMLFTEPVPASADAPAGAED